MYISHTIHLRPNITLHRKLSTQLEEGEDCSMDAYACMMHCPLLKMHTEPKPVRSSRYGLIPDVDQALITYLMRSSHCILVTASFQPKTHLQCAGYFGQVQVLIPDADQILITSSTPLESTMIKLKYCLDLNTSRLILLEDPHPF